ncbi:MAG: DegT/DnrJ/EryC1/StrS family aminotransferase [Planctomycetes bacterium]|nr:DegT/DnrJ/EryC1/StrS family aminotransferase [Planctomycetota bacterium]
MPIARPVLGAEEAERAAEVVRSGWVLQGPQVAAFEREFAAFVGAPHAVAVSSGTAALHLALLAVGVRHEDEVITVSHSFIATANSIRHCGARPVFVDVEPGTFNLDPARLAAAVTPATRAVLCVHQMGMPCDLGRILEFARGRGLPVVEDAACAAGSEIEVRGEWQRIGRPHADVATFSFHPRKLLTTGDGGMLTTANAEWDRRFRLWRAHGMGAEGEGFPVVGYNYRMTDVQAAVGREQLRRLAGLVLERRAQAARYRDLLGRIPGLGLPVEPAWARSNWQSWCVRLPGGVDQEATMRRLGEAGIATRTGIRNAHEQGAYADLCGGRPPALPESEAAQRRCVCLPLYPGLTAADQERVATALAAACAGGAGAGGAGAKRRRG